MLFTLLALTLHPSTVWPAARGTGAGLRRGIGSSNRGCDVLICVENILNVNLLWSKSTERKVKVSPHFKTRLHWRGRLYKFSKSWSFIIMSILWKWKRKKTDKTRVSIVTGRGQTKCEATSREFEGVGEGFLVRVLVINKKIVQGMQLFSPWGGGMFRQ